MSWSRPTASRRRGFTLIELMVALTGGLFFTVFVFMLTRDVTRFFQQESRLSDATLSAITGFERLRADVARAGFLASPNLLKDPKRCPPADVDAITSHNFSTNWGTKASELQKMGVMRVTTATSTTNRILNLSGRLPDTLTMYGNYTSSEQFPARSVQPASGKTIVYLDPTSGGLWRSGYRPTDTTPPSMEALLQQLFPAGRALRLVNEEGEEQYGIIESVSRGTGTNPTITLSVDLPIIEKSSGTTCGLRGLAGGVQVNTVNIIRYELQNLSTDARFAFVYKGDAPYADDVTERLELVRSEVFPDGTAVDGSAEIIAEYAVDFKVGIMAMDMATTPKTVFYGAGDTAIANFAGNAFTLTDPNKGPHLIRGAHVRLSVRTLDADRGGDVAASDTTGIPYRVMIRAGSSTTPPEYARVRSLQAMIATRNARDKVWK